MAVGRISGPLLKDNLLRNGVNLAFETNLLYLDVVNRRIGVNTSAPTNDLSVNGTTRTTNLQATNSATFAAIAFNGNTISSTSNVINLTPTGANPVIYQGTISVGNININTNTIATTGTNTNLEITTTGTGVVEFNSNVVVYGNLHATGNITADGNITLGNATTDNVVFAGEVNSNVIPSANNTYNLGSSANNWNNLYVNAITSTTINTTTISVPELKTANLDIIGNSITAYTANTDVNFVTSGTGGVILGNLKFNNNSITNISANAVTQFNQTSTNATFTGSIAAGPAIAFVGSISGNTLTVQSTPTWTTGGAIVLDQTSTPAFLTLNNPIIVGTSAYTVETYFYMTAGTSGALFGATADWGYGITINALTGANNVSVTALNKTTNNYTVDTIVLNTWNHIAVTRNSSGVETVFLNGVRASSGTTSTNINFYSASSLIGKQSGTNNFNGYLANFRLVVGSAVYDPSQSTITVPSSPLSVVTNTKLMLAVTNDTSLIIDAANVETITATNATFTAYSPFVPGLPLITAGHVISGSGVSPSVAIVSNISGSGTSAGSTWSLNERQGISSETLYSTPVILTVTGSPSGTITNNMTVTGNNIIVGTSIVAFGSGSGGAGTYFVTPLQTVTSEAMTGVVSGYVRFAGTYGVVVPSGTTAQRPASLYQETGMIRFNTELQLVEVYNGTIWASVAGTSSGVTSSTAQDIGVQTALALG